MLIRSTKNTIKRIAKKILNVKEIPMASSKLIFDGKIENDYGEILHSDETNTFIKTAINKGEPFIATRLGASELKTMNNYIVNNLSNYDGFNQEIIYELFTHSGVFPNQPKIVGDFCEVYLNSIRNADLIGVWDNRGEGFLINMLAPFAKLCRLGSLEPFFSNDPWSQYLEGKKVLVIHPFEKTIQSQYQNRNNIFKNENLLPEFELKTLKAVQSLSGADENFKDWFEAFNFMKGEIAKRDFDVAIIGAGSYGLPLAAFVKEKGKVAIHLGGASQLLFGIKGKRWVEREIFLGLMNESWVFPMAEEKPEFGGRVDGTGPYWS